MTMPANDLKCGITLEDGRCAVLTVVCRSFELDLHQYPGRPEALWCAMKATFWRS